MNIIDGLTADDVLLMPKYSEISSRSSVDLSVDLGKGIVLKNPIVAANMMNVCGAEMAVAISDLGGMAILHRFMDYEEIPKLFKSLIEQESWRAGHIGCSVGVHEKDKKLVKDCVAAGCKIICVDIAHGHSKVGMDMTTWIHENYPDVLLISGNVATADGAEALYKSGADVVKCGIGGGCFAAGTRVLMSNGTCKNIENIEIGDRVINKDGKPVSVKNVVMTGIKKVVKIKHDLSYKETFVTPDHKYWVGDSNTMSDSFWKDGNIVKKLDLLTKKGESKFKWKEIKDLNKDCFLMPNKINFELKDDFNIEIKKRNGGNGRDNKYIVDKNLQPSYDLGYVFGTFLGDGNALKSKYKNSNIGSVTWYFGLNEEHIVNKLNKCIENIFNKKLAVKKTGSIFNCKLYYKPLADYLFSFGKKDKKHLPSELLISNKEYLQGILDGLIDSDGHTEAYGRKRLSSTSQQLIELFSFISYMLNGTFASGVERKPSTGNLKNCNIEKCLVSYNSSINKTASKKLTKDYQVSQIRKKEFLDVSVPVYDIEVDCETHSFIADFAIVHNSICTTRIETGNGVSQLTALEMAFKNSLCCDKNEQGNILKVKRKYKVIADGGIRKAGDAVKYLCFSDAVMLGNVLAGTNEAPGETFSIEGVTYKKYAGSSTHKSNHVEGVVGLVPSKGPVKDVCRHFLEGISSGCSYQGVDNLIDIKKNPTFIRISNAGLTESHAHDIKLIK